MKLRNAPRLVLVLLAGLGLATGGPAAPLQQVDDETRQRLLSLNALTGDEAIKGELKQILAKPVEAKKLVGAAMKMRKEKPQPFKPNATMVLAVVAEQLKSHDAAETFYRLHAEQSLQLLSGKGLGFAYSGLIRILYDTKRYAEVEKVCREFLEMDGDEQITQRKPAILERMILAMAKQGETGKALEVLDRLIKRQPENWLMLEMKAMVLHEAGKLDDALKTYEDVSDKIKNDKRLKKEEQDDFLDAIRYSLSGVYIDRNEVDKAAEQLKALLAREPNSARYNNDLGYVWADHDMNLAESEKLIRKALEEDRRRRKQDNPDLTPEEDKDNSAYLDSLGWVLYKQKKFKEAKPLLVEAVKDDESQSPEVWDHLAEVHMALGEKDDAVAAWKKGISVAGTGKRDKDRKALIEKKLKALKKD
jgi:tetratricopeptide (TPR) repeat protein